MSKKIKYLERTQRDLVHSKFIIDQRYTQTLKPQISDWFKKMKPLPGLSRIFQDYNKRYFTLNLLEITLYYSNKERYSLNDITYIPFEEVQSVSDKPHYALSNQGVEWKEAFGFTIYLTDKYIVLVAQSNEIYMLWLNYLEAIRFRSNGKSILQRQRTPYYSNLFAINLPDLKNTQFQSQELKLKKEQSNPESKDLDKPIYQTKDDKQLAQTPDNEDIINHQEIDQKGSSLQLEQFKNQDNCIYSQNIIQDYNIIEIKEKQSSLDQQNEGKNKPIIQKEIELKAVNMDFLEQETSQITIIGHQNEQIILLNKQDQLISKDDEEKLSYLPQPRRLDKIKKKQSLNNHQQPIKITQKKTITNIWGTYDNDIIEGTNNNGNIKKIDQAPKQIQSLFLNIQESHDQIEDNQVDQPELLVKFDELDSSRWTEQQ
ncbi:unnamed protein product [Paramecium pentaurelia]|uniref:PH domain-containing protein n=1 Tax=Paramecium pentaurelia TaxID=43138 RepID=A0A8S1VWV8_9CILI|nr:unnamed protein product [Paramecium pentaurelia]